MITNSPVAHSYLFVPGNRPERFGKALAAGADAVIIDLEDAVAPADKGAARDALSNWLDSAEAKANKVPVLVRINCVASGCIGDDLRLCHRPSIAGIVLPKTERFDDVASASSTAPLYPLIETAVGFSRVAELCAGPRVVRLMFGNIDFSLDMGILGDREELLYYRSQMVLLSRLAQLQPPVDGVTIAFDDAVRTEGDALHSRRLGFGGKLCVHPSQVPVVNAVYAPTRDELGWANRVLAAAESAGGGAVALDGKMIDRPVILHAQRIIEDSRRRNPV